MKTDMKNTPLEGLIKNVPSLKLIAFGAASLILIIISFMVTGVNDAGQRTVVQYPNGTLYVKFEPGLYFQLFGSTEVYNDVITFDFDKTKNGEGSTIDQQGIAVRYQDGGMGEIYGIARFRLPVDEKSMIAVHKEFRSNSGVAYKIIKNTTEEIVNHTAGLMSSEESYAEKRGTFSQWAKEQLSKAKYATEQREITTAEAGYEFCLDDDILTKEQMAECKNVKKTKKMIPVISMKNGMPVFESSDLLQYGIELSGFNIVDWGYEDKTLAQISDKRAATMAIITSKANAEKAKQDAVTAEQQGLADVMKAKYEKEVEKAKAVVAAEQEKEVAVVKAKQGVDVAEQLKLEQTQLKLAAFEAEKKLIAEGRGEGEKRRLIMQADGALTQKLEAYIKVQSRFAEAIEKQKWVPDIQMGGSGSGSGSAASDLINMLNVQTAKDLSLNMKVK